MVSGIKSNIQMCDSLYLNQADDGKAAVAETAIIGVPDDLTGEAINAVVSLKTSGMPLGIEDDLILHIRQSIAPFAAPKKVFIVKDLPKTRSGKIVRRILRKALSGEREFGDISTVRISFYTIQSNRIKVLIPS